MTENEIEEYFQYHNSNIRLLKIGFDEIRNQIKNIYLSKNKTGEFIYILSETDSQKIEKRKLEKSLSRILSGIQVSWAEESIKRLLYEKNLLNDVQRNYLLELPALDQRWYKTLKIIFCIAYDLVKSNDEICKDVNISQEKNNLGHDIVSNYSNLQKLITDFLVPNISIRNKVQHGEWEFAFKPSFSKEFSSELTMKLNNENIITTTSRYTLVNAMYQMIVDLARFKSNSFALDSMQTPFEYFFKRYLRKINFEIHKISNSELDEYINESINREIRGIQHKNNK